MLRLLVLAPGCVIQDTGSTRQVFDVPTELAVSEVAAPPADVGGSVRWHGDEAASMSEPEPSAAETFNPWSVVNLVFHHLAAKGLHPVLGEAGDPARPAAELLQALGIEPGPERSEHTRRDISQQLADLRAAVLGERP